MERARMGRGGVTRSSSLAEPLLGHQWVLDFLRRCLAEGRASHAYLLTGPTHVGKLTTALAMAQVLLCSDGTACGFCRDCSLVERRIHPDLRVLELPEDKKTIPIQDVHEFSRGIALKPLEAARKVYVVDSADLLREDGANAFLKTLEEPPPAVTLLLTATDPARLLPTVVSRCQRIALRPVATREIEAHLTDRGTDPVEAGAIARASHGLPGWALLTVEQPGRLVERRDRAADLARLLEASRLERIRYADSLAERWAPNSEQVVSTLEIWIESWRELMRAHLGLAEAMPDLQGIAPQVAPSARAGLSATIGALEALRANAHPRLTLEALLLGWPKVASL